MGIGWDPQNGFEWAWDRQRRISDAGMKKQMEPFETLLTQRPPPAPDLTDEVVQAARRAELRRHQVGQTRKSTFLTGPAGSNSGGSGY